MRDYLEELVDLVETEEEETVIQILMGQIGIPGAGGNMGQEQQEDAGQNQEVAQGQLRKANARQGQDAEERQTRGANMRQDQKSNTRQRQNEEETQEALGPLELSQQLERSAVVSSVIPGQVVQRRREQASEAETPVRAAGALDAEGFLPVREVAEREETAQVLRRSILRMEQAAGYRAAVSGAESVSLQRETVLQRDGVAGTAGIEARQVDRVFERDARRYDNRFTLF